MIIAGRGRMFGQRSGKREEVGSDWWDEGGRLEQNGEKRDSFEGRGRRGEDIKMREIQRGEGGGGVKICIII